MIQNTPTIRKRKPSMSAIAAKVFSGLMNDAIPAIANATPKIA